MFGAWGHVYFFINILVTKLENILKKVLHNLHILYIQGGRGPDYLHVYMFFVQVCMRLTLHK